MINNGILPYVITVAITACVVAFIIAVASYCQSTELKRLELKRACVESGRSPVECMLITSDVHTN
jgi:hypothetical protein